MSLPIMAASLITGCGTPPGEMFEPASTAPVWPPPPDTPRVRYVGQIRSEEDLRPGRGFLQGLGEALFGKDAPRALVNPMAVCTDNATRVFVIDSTQRVVHVFDLDARTYARWTGAAPTGLVLPIAAAFDPVRGRLLVSDAAAGSIVVFDPGGREVTRIGAGSLTRPCGLAVDPTGGVVYVADPGAHAVLALGMDGQTIARVGGRGSGPGEFNYPTHVAVGRDGRVYVSDSLNFRVQVLGPDLRPLAQIGRKGDMPGYFAQPKGLALDPENHLYVVDANFEAVQVFDAEGRLLMAFGREGRRPGEFWLPAGIWIDGRGRVWIADSFNSRVQVFDYLPERSQREAQAP